MKNFDSKKETMKKSSENLLTANEILFYFKEIKENKIITVSLDTNEIVQFKFETFYDIVYSNIAGLFERKLKTNIAEKHIRKYEYEFIRNRYGEIIPEYFI